MDRNLITCCLMVLASFFSQATSALPEPAALDSVLVPISPQAPQLVASPLKQMQALRAQGKLKPALALGQQYLNAKPAHLDFDVMLVMGLMLSQEKQYAEATRYFNQVLLLSPQYLEPKLGLAEIAMAQQQMQQADLLIKQLVQQAPQDPRVKKIQQNFQSLMSKPFVSVPKPKPKVLTFLDYYKNGDVKDALPLARKALIQNPHDNTARLILAKCYAAEKQYPQAESEFEQLLMQNESNKEAWLGLIDLQLAAGHDYSAYLTIKAALKRYPQDPAFLVRKSALDLLQHKYPMAAYRSQQLLKDYPQSEAVKPAKDILNTIEELNPHLARGVNEVGINSEVDYISDLKTEWQYSNAYYNRDMPWGLLSLNLNNTTRFGVTANQGQLNLLPVVNRNLYFRLTAAYANQPLLFPTYIGGAEAFFSGAPLELSFGSTYSYILPQIAFTQYTASFSKEWRKYWLSFRPIFYMPQFGNQSTLYTATLIRYFGPKDTYVKLTAATGRSPDLANLTTIDFIVIKNNYVTLNVQVPLLQHRLLLNIGGDFQHWVFPNSLVRNISGMNIGLNYRFEDKRTYAKPRSLR